VSLSSDHSGDPAGRLDDLATEALLAGRAVRAWDEPLAVVVRALRDVTACPVPPSAELARRMAAGAFPGDRTARSPLRTVHATPESRTVHAAPELAGLRSGARAFAVGLTAVLVAGSTAGFAGVLPGPVQEGFQIVVETVTRYEFPQRASSGAGLEPSPGSENRPGDSRDRRARVREDRLGGPDHPGGQTRPGGWPPAAPAAADSSSAGPPERDGPPGGAGPPERDGTSGGAVPSGAGPSDNAGPPGGTDDSPAAPPGGDAPDGGATPDSGDTPDGGATPDGEDTPDGTAPLPGEGPQGGTSGDGPAAGPDRPDQSTGPPTDR
jgi:hypothetical protein